MCSLLMAGHEILGKSVGADGIFLSRRLEQSLDRSIDQQVIGQ